jgi:hypothetical protein
MFAWYQKADQILAAENANDEERLKTSQAFCKKHPSVACEKTVSHLKSYAAIRKHWQFLVPHWKAMKYDAESMAEPVPASAIIGQWAMVPLDIGTPDYSIANIADFKADGTVDLHTFQCNWKKHAVEPGTIDKDTWQISGKRILIHEADGHNTALDVKFIGTNEMSASQEIKAAPKESIDIDYRRTKDFHPTCDEYFDEHSPIN